MKTRIVVGLVAIPLTLLPVWLGGIWCTALFLGVGIAGGLEFYHMLQTAGYRPNLWLGLIWLTLLILNGWQPLLLPLPLLLAAGLIITFIDALRHEEQPLGMWMATSMAALYLGTTIGQSLAMRQLPNGFWWLVFSFSVTWLNDTAAYFIGVSLGRHKFWPRISPKKTWEGTLSGWLAAALTGGVLAWLLPLHITVGFGVALGTACGIMALLGDLSISMLKRQVGVKDSGRFFPGHGGMLDRVDSILFVLPFVYQVILVWPRS